MENTTVLRVQRTSCVIHLKLVCRTRLQVRAVPVGASGIDAVPHFRKRRISMRERSSVVKHLAYLLCLAGMCFCVATGQAQEARKLLSQSQPDYPELAKRMRLQGTVKVQIIIGTDGIIKNTKVVGGNPVLVEATLEALKKWKYAPSSSETSTTLEFNFHPPS